MGSVACFGMIRTTVMAVEAAAGETKPLLYEPRDYALNSLAEGGGDEEEAGASWIERMPQPWRRLTSVNRTHTRLALFCIFPRFLRRLLQMPCISSRVAVAHALPCTISVSAFRACCFCCLHEPCDLLRSPLETRSEYIAAF